MSKIIIQKCDGKYNKMSVPKKRPIRFMVAINWFKQELTFNEFYYTILIHILRYYSMHILVTFLFCRNKLNLKWPFKVALIGIYTLNSAIIL